MVYVPLVIYVYRWSGEEGENGSSGRISALEMSGENQYWEVRQLLFQMTAVVGDSEEAVSRLVREFEKVHDRRKIKINNGKK